MVAEKLKSNLEKFVSIDKSGNQIGSILVDEHSNSLIVQALKPDMDNILAIIKRLDRPTPQVLIEAYIVEANKDVARELGVQWGGIYAGKSGDRRAIVSGQQGDGSITRTYIQNAGFAGQGLKLCKPEILDLLVIVTFKVAWQGSQITLFPIFTPMLMCRISHY